MSKWTGVSEAYRRSFSTLCAGTIGAILDAVDLRPGSTLLDAGSGTGDLAVAASTRCARVTAVDSDPDMVAMTRERTPGDAVEAALPRLPFGNGSFDAVVANFVVNHVDDPRAAIRELGRVAADGAPVAMTIWPAGGPGWGPLIAEIFEAAQARQVPSGKLPAHLDFARTVDGLAEIAEEAGLSVVEAREVMWTWEVAPGDLRAGIEGGVATPGRIWLAQDGATQARIRTEYARRTAALAEDGLLRFPSRAAFVVAQS